MIVRSWNCHGKDDSYSRRWTTPEDCGFPYWQDWRSCSYPFPCSRVGNDRRTPMRNSFAKQTAFRRIDGIARGLERHGSRVMEVLFLRNFGRSQMDRFPAETSEKPETFTRTCSIFRTFPYSLGGIAPLSPSGDINFIVPPPPDVFLYHSSSIDSRKGARENEYSLGTIQCWKDIPSEYSIGKKGSDFHEF